MTDSGQTYSDLEIVLSIAGVLATESDDNGTQWLRRNQPRQYLSEWPEDFDTWAEWCLLESTGNVGNVYHPTLYFDGKSTQARWPENLGTPRWRLDREIVMAHPSLFQHDRFGLVFRKPTQVLIGEMFLAAAGDQLAGTPRIPYIQYALDGEVQPVTVSDTAEIPSLLYRMYPNEELIVLPWYVEMMQWELSFSPFNFSPKDFRAGTSISFQEIVFNLSRNRFRDLNLELPLWAMPLSSQELSSNIGKSPGRTIREKFEYEPLLKQESREELLAQISNGGPLSEEQWRLIADLSDIRCPHEGAKVIKSLERLPRYEKENFWSKLFNQILEVVRAKSRGRRKDGVIISRCCLENCWNRYTLHDYRQKFCPIHRSDQAGHRTTSARQARRHRERSMYGEEWLRCKWRAQKVHQRKRLTRTRQPPRK